MLIDGLRADLCYGEQGSAKTPILSRLRQQGTSFNQAIAAASSTSPCVGSIMTSLYPFAHGLRHSVGYRLTPACRSLAESLRQHGYQTCAMVTGGSVLPDTGLNRGFDEYDIRERDEHLYSEWRKRLDAQLDRLARQREGWFFLLHLWEVHVPQYFSPSFNRPQFGKTRYERALSSLDHELGKILERIDLERTCIVLHGDHGERFENSILETAIRKAKFHLLGWGGGRGWYKLNHGYHVYEFLVRVPLLFIGRGLFPAGRQIETQVRQIDIMPTILEAMSIPLDQHMRIHGRSLLPLIRGEQSGELPALMEASADAIPDSRSWLRGIRVPPWKYVYAPRNPKIRPELYHLGEDPRESTNLLDRYPSIAQSLRRTIEEICSADEVRTPVQTS